MGKDLQWIPFVKVEAQPWFSAETKMWHDQYVHNVGIVERDRAVIDAEFANLQATPICDPRGPKPEDAPAKVTELRGRVLKLLLGEGSIRSELRTLLSMVSRDGSAECERLYKQAESDKESLVKWLETGPEGFGGYARFNGSEPMPGCWYPGMLENHPHIKRLKASANDCNCTWIADFNRKNDADAKVSRERMEGMHAALLAV